MGINPGFIAGLPSHRFPTYISSMYGDFVLYPRLQGEDISADIPKEIIDEIGNEESAGIVTDTAQVTATLNNYLVSSMVQKLISGNFGTVGAVSDSTGTSFTSAPTKMRAVAPLKITGDGTYTLTATSGTTFTVKDSSGNIINDEVAEYNTDEIVKDIPGLELIVQTDAPLSSGDEATFVITKSTSGDINEDFADAQVDVMVRYRNPSGTYFVSEYLQGLTLQSIAYSLDVGGNTVETYTCEGDNRTLYNGHIIRASYFAQSSDDAQTTIDLDTAKVITGSEAVVQSKVGGYYTGKYFLKVLKKTSAGVNTILTETTGTPSTDEYSFNPSTNVVTFGDTVSSGDWYQFTYFSQAIDTTHDYSMDFQKYTTVPAIRTRKCPIKITGTGSAVQVSYPQAVSINVAFNRTRIEGIGMGDSVLYSSAGVVKVSGSLSVNITDLEFDRLITQGDANASVDEIAINEYSDYGANNDLDLSIEVKNPADSTTTFVKLDLDGIVPGSVPLSVPLGGIATTSIDFESKTGDMTLTWGD